MEADEALEWLRKLADAKAAEHEVHALQAEIVVQPSTHDPSDMLVKIRKGGLTVAPPLKFDAVSFLTVEGRRRIEGNVDRFIRAFINNETKS